MVLALPSVSACREAVASVILPKPGSGGGSVPDLLLGTQCVTGRGKVAGCLCELLGTGLSSRTVTDGGFSSALVLQRGFVTLPHITVCVCVYS